MAYDTLTVGRPATRGRHDNSQSASPTEAKTLLLACGALAREITEIIRLNQWRHFHLHCLPASLHLYPDRIPAEVERAVVKFRKRYDNVFVVYADCGTGGLLEKKCRELGVEMIAGPHCYAFYDGLEAYASREETDITSFYLTDFLVRQFESFVIKPLGLDRFPQLLETYFGHYTKVVYLAQTDDPGLEGKARQCAARLQLDFERRFTGYGDLERALSMPRLRDSAVSQHS
ncbi:MAG: DUF1638 domain-containing protein [Rhodobacteraceae bacterium]|nr:DUF1638 domain-containing protein [Paracoccaceae bacterium]